MSKWRILSLVWIVVFAIGTVVIFINAIPKSNDQATLKLGSLVVWIGIFILIAIVQTVAYTVYNLLLNNKTPH